MRTAGADVLRDALATLRLDVAAFFCDTFAGAFADALLLAGVFVGATFLATGCFFAIVLGTFAAARLRLEAPVADAFFAGACAATSLGFADNAFVPRAGAADCLLGAAAVFRATACFNPAFFMTNLVG